MVATHFGREGYVQLARNAATGRRQLYWLRHCIAGAAVGLRLAATLSCAHAECLPRTRQTLGKGLLRNRRHWGIAASWAGRTANASFIAVELAKALTLHLQITDQRRAIHLPVAEMASWHSINKTIGGQRRSAGRPCLQPHSATPKKRQH